MRRSPRPTRKARRTATTTSPNPQRSRMEARGAFRSHPWLVGISHSAPAYNSTTHGPLTITTAEEISRLATGLRLCLRSKSKRSSTLSKWYVALSTVHVMLANTTLRRWKSTRRQNLTHISFNDYASTSWTWRLGEYLPTSALGIGAHSIYELIVSSSSIFWLRWICPFLS